jgi:hypothetical protein
MSVSVSVNGTSRLVTFVVAIALFLLLTLGGAYHVLSGDYGTRPLLSSPTTSLLGDGAYGEADLVVTLLPWRLQQEHQALVTSGTVKLPLDGNHHYPVQLLAAGDSRLIQPLPAGRLAALPIQAVVADAGPARDCVA